MCLIILCGVSNILLLSCSLFLKFIEDQAAPSWLGYFYAFSMFLLGCLQTLFEQRYMYMCLVLGLRLRTAVTGLVYRKVRVQILFLLLLFSSPILVVMMLYIVHSNIRGDVTRN